RSIVRVGHTNIGRVTLAVTTISRRGFARSLFPLGLPAAALALAACGGAKPSTGDEAAAKPAPSGPQRVETWWSIADSNPSVSPCWEEFKKRHAGWTGELTMGVTYDKFQASIAGGVSPDAYFGSFQQIQAAAFKKIFAPLDQYINRDKVNMDQYFFGSKAGAVYKGKIYGMPHHSDVRSIYVN